MKSIILSSILAFGSSAFSLEQAAVFDTISDYIVSGKTCDERPYENFWTTKTINTRVHRSFWAKGDYALTYSKFGCGIGENGSVVISPGRTESSIEFYETALDLVAEGFSPVYVVDQVGQGFSERFLEDNHKGHIFRFSDYVDAFEDAVNDIEDDLAEVEGRRDSETDPLFFLSNSMGGAIGIGYFQKLGARNPFKSAALLGAMIRVNYLGFPTGDPNLPNGITNPTGLQTRLFSETGVIAQARVYCKWFGCDAYATAGARELAEENGSAYLENRRYVTVYESAPEQAMTHSKERYDLRTQVWENDEIKAVYELMGLSNPQLAAPTYQWAKQTAKFNRDMRDDESIEKMNEMSMLMLTGERDVRAYTPYEDGSFDLSEHVKFCNNVKLIKGNSVCDFEEIDGAFHELHKESDDYRVPVLNKVVEHFKK